MAKNFNDFEEENNKYAPGEDEEDEFVEYDDAPEEDEEYEDEFEDEDEEYEDDEESDEYDESEEEADEEFEDDEEYEDGEYEDEDFDDAELEDDEEEYDDESEEDGDEFEDEDDGSAIPIFRKLNARFKESDDEEEEADDLDDAGFEDAPESYDSDDEGEPASSPLLERLAALADNEILLYVLLVVLPPLGLFLLWYTRKFDDKKRLFLTIISVLILIIWLVLLFRGGKDDNVTPGNTNVFAGTQTTAPTQQPTQSVNVFATNTPEPIPTPHVSTPDETTPVEAESEYVYVTNSGLYYHTLENCGGITNASKITIDLAKSRGFTACADCAGGVNDYADPEVKYYATTKGTWYHTDPTCQKMTGATVVKEADAIKAGKTAYPVCIGYYGTPGGQWYHSISNCQKMSGAVTKTKADWEKQGKTACPICLGGNTGIKGNATPTETMVYATANGTYFHTQSNCTGMKNASQNTISRAVNMGKKPCSKCVKASQIYVFATASGTYYHTKNNCTGMKNAQYITAETAIRYGKTACPTCAKAVAFSTGSAANTTTAPTSTTVYATTDGTYFHTNASCSGMKNAKKVTFAQAVSAGKKPCKTCITPAKLTVFCTSGGKYYHTNSTCTGMTGAVAMTAQNAMKYGKTACPTCSKALQSVSGMSEPETAMLASTATTTWTNASLVTTESASTTSTVYIKLGSGNTAYYHTTAKCAGQNISNLTPVTLEYSMSHGYRACPSCNPPTNMYM